MNRLKLMTPSLHLIGRFDLILMAPPSDSTTDWDLNTTHSEMRSIWDNLGIKWHEKAPTATKKYTGVSRTTSWRRRKRAEEVSNLVSKCRRIDEMFGSSKPSSRSSILDVHHPSEDEADASYKPTSEELQKDHQAEQEVFLCEIGAFRRYHYEAARGSPSEHLKQSSSKRSDVHAATSYAVTRMMAVLAYFTVVLDGVKRVAASEQVARILMPADPIRNAGVRVRSWGKTYLLT